jgi:16S rRNA (cytidine1402-2'-O)-methyltransferase
MDLFKFAEGQNLPKGALYVVATPIGNLADITIRALYVLQQVDGIACEDKRHSSSLLTAYGISKPLLAVHEHNEKSSSALVIDKLKLGERWAYISDAGTPAISDPGSVLVQEVRAAGLHVVPLPGASAITTAISASGDFLNKTDGHFQFLGFLPTKAGQKIAVIGTASKSATASFFYEAPHRIQATLKTLHEHLDKDRKIFIAKELSKIHENIQIVKAGDIPAWMEQVESWQGEYVLGIEGSGAVNVPSVFDENTLEWVHLLQPHFSHKDLSEIVSTISKMPKKDVYKQLLDLKHP